MERETKTLLFLVLQNVIMALQSENIIDKQQYLMQAQTKLMEFYNDYENS